MMSIPRAVRPQLSLICFVFVALLRSTCQGQEVDFIVERDTMIPMRDGTKLAANVFRPKNGGPAPVILMRTPYGKPDEKWGDAKRYTAAGYALVAQDCRGRGKSEGAWDPFRYDVEDGFDTQEWVGVQTWCNGEIGTAGGSYVGWTQWASAPNASRYLKCMVPVVPFADVFHDIAYPGGAFQLALLMGWGSTVGGIVLPPDKLQASYRHVPLRSFADQFDKKVTYLTDWITNNSYGAYWKKRGIEHRYRDVTVPTLNIGGWYDIFSKTTIELMDRVREQSRDRHVRRNQFVVMGPWTHGVGVQKAGEMDFGPEAKLNTGDLQFKWFEFWLKHRDTGVEDWPAYYLFVMGENQWRGENEWPLKRTQFKSFYLRSGGRANSLKGDGTLDLEKPAEEPADTYHYDPNQPVPTHGGNNLFGATAGPYDQSKIEEREDVLVYSSAPLEQPVEVTGPVKMVLHAASSARDTDFTAKLVDVHPDGKAYNLCDGIIRARYRNGMDEPQLLEADKVVRYEIDLWVTSNLFKPGHRIRVEIASSNFPRFDRNLNTGLPIGTDTELKIARQTVRHSAEHPSHILLPVIPR